MTRNFSILLLLIFSCLLLFNGETIAQDEKKKKKKNKNKKSELIANDSIVNITKNDTIEINIKCDSLKIADNDSTKYDRTDSIAKQEEIIKIDYIDESNRILRSNIKSVLLHRDGWDLSPSLIRYNTDEKLLLSFDDLDGDVKEYIYTIVHCDANWEPSDLRKDEYIDGYYEDYIYEYSFSLNTIQPYTHYELLFPTQDLEPKVSGNYIMKVFVEQEDSLYFTRRFMIMEPKVEIEGEIKQATMLNDRNYKQEVDFSFNTGGYRIVNAYRYLKVVVIQNGRWDNALMDLKPKMVIGNTYDYNYDLENVFDGGNEFRAFDVKSLTYNTENVINIEQSYAGYDIYLRELERRTFQVYKSDDDINGQMKIKTEDYTITETEAEYVNIHFFLPYPAPMVDADIFIIGQFTDWRYSEDSKMNYNYKRKGYDKTILLKQGYYNYHYILRYHNQTVGDVSFIEGNHWETENNYSIFIYNRELGADYDKLIGVKHINSVNE